MRTLKPPVQGFVALFRQDGPVFLFYKSAFSTTNASHFVSVWYGMVGKIDFPTNITRYGGS